MGNLTTQDDTPNGLTGRSDFPLKLGDDINGQPDANGYTQKAVSLDTSGQDAGAAGEGSHKLNENT
jgi:hypothetical protein